MTAGGKFQATAQIGQETSRLRRYLRNAALFNELQALADCFLARGE